jgi:hypothetical protein
METLLRSLDERLGRIEQILPTLATKDDLKAFPTADDPKGFAMKADLAGFATKGDLEAFATKGDLEAFATKSDLTAFATKVDLEQGLSGLRTLIEDSRSDTRLLAEHVARLIEQVEPRR